jgi:hypothetical protein
MILREQRSRRNSLLCHAYLQLFSSALAKSCFRSNNVQCIEHAFSHRYGTTTFNILAEKLYIVIMNLEITEFYLGVTVFITNRV